MSQILKSFEAYLQSNRFNQKPQNLYHPINYILENSGKRIRPQLVLMSCQLFDDDFEKALPAALAIEIFHNFTLVHDDIMDQAPLRRGIPTIEAKYGTNTAILSGDVMLIYAYEYLLKVEDKTKIPQMMKDFNQIAIEVCEGQQYDVDFESRNEVSIPEYLKMIEFKTASLLAGAMKIGATIGGASESDCRNIEGFARNIGIAFQLQDDLLDAFGDPEKFGKKVGGDIVQNKKTYLYLKALEIADKVNIQALTHYYTDYTGNESEKIESVKEIFSALNIKALTLKLEHEYADKAFQCLDKLSCNENSKLFLKEWANQLFIRES